MILYPYMFTKTVIAYGLNEEDARDNLHEIIEDQGDDIFDGWSCDSLSSDKSEVWKPIKLAD
mgnify:FL=1